IFFASRRRHTRSKRDWSSDVCSSDLEADYIFENTFYSPRQMHAFIETEGGWGMLKPDGSLMIQCPAQYGHRDKLQIARALALNRSEERRVGKGGRIKKWTIDTKNNNR